MIDIKGKNKAKVLAALYNKTHVQGMGILHFDPCDMTEQEAQAILDGGQTYFDYLKGRVMKVDLSRDSFEEGLYDRDNYPGAAYDAVKDVT